jgi:NAD-dependent SIR2 family protein deacetylase
LWQAGILKHIISQNVDGLHRKSGISSSSLSELHGNIFVERCTQCGQEYERDYNVICPGGFTGRHCDQGRACGGRLRHSGVGFGDDLPEKIVQKAWAESERADLCLALGSSITVTPASEMPAWVARRHQQSPSKGLVIVNLQATPCDKQALLRVNGMVDDVMERVEAHLRADAALQ